MLVGGTVLRAEIWEIEWAYVFESYIFLDTAFIPQP